LKDNLYLNLNHLCNDLLVNQTNIQQYLYGNKQYTNIGGIIIKINTMKNNMVFVKVLSLQDLIHSFKVVLCFENSNTFKKFNENVSKYDYIWTSLESNKLTQRCQILHQQKGQISVLYKYPWTWSFGEKRRLFIPECKW
jgi:hypothetical protein